MMTAFTKWLADRFDVDQRAVRVALLCTAMFLVGWFLARSATRYDAPAPAVAATPESAYTPYGVITQVWGTRDGKTRTRSELVSWVIVKVSDDQYVWKIIPETYKANWREFKDGSHTPIAAGTIKALPPTWTLWDEPHVFPPKGSTATMDEWTQAEARSLFRYGQSLYEADESNPERYSGYLSHRYFASN